MNEVERCLRASRLFLTTSPFSPLFPFHLCTTGTGTGTGRYAQRLDEILRRKQQLITLLRGKLTVFRQRLAEEESAATTVNMTRR